MNNNTNENKALGMQTQISLFKKSTGKVVKKSYVCWNNIITFFG